MSKVLRSAEQSRSSRGDRLAVTGFVISVVFICLCAGFAVAAFQLPPYARLRQLMDIAADAAIHWRNEFGLRPTRSLVAAPSSRARGVVSAPGRAVPGYRLVAGFAVERSTTIGALLFDVAGNEIHFWPIDYALLDPDGPRPRNVFVHGVEALRDGSLVVNFDEGRVIARIDACGDIVWVTRGAFHHTVFRSHDGTLWSLKGRMLVQLDAETGAQLREISLVDDIIKQKGLQGIFGMHGITDEHELKFKGDAFHLNDIEILGPEKAGAFPQFRTGDIMLSARSVNLVVILDGTTLDLRWWSNGPWHRQHDPDFLPDGTISVFNNNMGVGASDITVIDPRTRESHRAFAGSPDRPFYSYQRGKHQALAHGHWLITETEGGRAFEVDADGAVVWEFNNYFDEASNGYVSQAIHLPEDFYGSTAPSCTRNE